VSATSTVSDARSVVVVSETSIWEPTSFRAKRLPSSLNRSRPSILSWSMRPVSTNPWLVVWASPSFVGSAPSVTTMPWSSTFSAPAWRICSTFATANSPSRPSSFWPTSSSHASNTSTPSPSSTVISSLTTSSWALAREATKSMSSILALPVSVSCVLAHLSNSDC
jgi:hypothetical protein